VLGFSVDGVKQEINEYAASTASGPPDQSGRKGLTYNVVIHRNVSSGMHSVVVTNDSTDDQRDMVEGDRSQIYGVDIDTPSGETRRRRRIRARHPRRHCWHHRVPGMGGVDREPLASSR